MCPSGRRAGVCIPPGVTAPHTGSNPVMSSKMGKGRRLHPVDPPKPRTSGRELQLPTQSGTSFSRYRTASVLRSVSAAARRISSCSLPNLCHKTVTCVAGQRRAADQASYWGSRCSWWAVVADRGHQSRLRSRWRRRVLARGRLSRCPGCGWPGPECAGSRIVRRRGLRVVRSEAVPQTQETGGLLTVLAEFRNESAVTCSGPGDSGVEFLDESGW